MTYGGPRGQGMISFLLRHQKIKRLLVPLFLPLFLLSRFFFGWTWGSGRELVREAAGEDAMGVEAKIVG